MSRLRVEANAGTLAPGVANSTTAYDLSFAMKSAAHSRFAHGSIETFVDAVHGCGLIASPPPVTSPPPFGRVVVALAPPRAVVLG